MKIITGHWYEGKINTPVCGGDITNTSARGRNENVYARVCIAVDANNTQNKGSHHDVAGLKKHEKHAEHDQGSAAAAAT